MSKKLKCRKTVRKPPKMWNNSQNKIKNVEKPQKLSKNRQNLEKQSKNCQKC